MTEFANIFGSGFDTHSVEPQTDFDIIPPGKYPVIIDKAELNETQARNGYLIALVMTILDDPYKGKELRDWINIDNPSTKCVEIGLRTLAALGQSLGIAKLTDEAQLTGGIAIAHVRVKNDQNDIRTYSAVEGQQQQQQQPQQTQVQQVLQPQQAQTQPTQQHVPPWKR